MIKINKWNDTFENADSRKRQRLGWYYTPSGNDSAGYRKLMRNGTDGVIALGFFNSLCQHMATLKREIRINGIFCNNDGSIMDIEDISEVTRISVADIQHACGILVKCGWITLETTTICQSSASHLPLPADDLPTLCKEKEKAKIKEKNIHQQADKDSIFPKGSLSKSIYEQKRTKVLRNMPMMVRIGKWFNRKEETLWTVSEANALKQVKPSNDEIDVLEKYYSERTEDKPLRKSIDTLLNHWSSELDKANTHTTTTTTKPHQTANYVTQL